MDEETMNMALDIVNQRIAELMKLCVYNKGKDDDLQKKIRVLEEIKDKIYSGNVGFAEKMLENNKKGKI